MVDQDVLVTVTVSTVPFRGNAMAAVRIEATVKPEWARILSVEVLEKLRREMKRKILFSLRHWS
jgi:hypothetical protein